MSHVRIGKVSMKHQKKFPFWKDRKGRIGFNYRTGVRIAYGVSFSPDRGHRVYFNYCDTPELKNTWGTESLRKYIKENLIGINAELDNVAKIYLATCDLCDDMQRRWVEAGKPDEGVPDHPGKPN